METITLSREEFEQLKRRSDSWIKLAGEIEDLYIDESGEPKEDGDLADIGEAAAIAFGWL